MADQTTRKSPAATELRVLRTEWLTPHMVRVIAGGSGLTSFVDNGYADHYVKMVFAPAGVTYPEPFDRDTIRATFPRDQWPINRTYTVRSIDLDAGELAIDFVYHGDEGIAGPWAATTKPGDPVVLLGPGGKYTPDTEADWHLLVGDESALPALANALERMPAGTPVRALIEVADASEEQSLPTPGDAEITWLHRDKTPADGTSGLVQAVRALEFPPGQVHAFVHGEAGTVMKQLRPHLLKERGVPREWLSISGYWRRGNTEESFREWKAAEKENEQGEQAG